MQGAAPQLGLLLPVSPPPPITVKIVVSEASVIPPQASFAMASRSSVCTGELVYRPDPSASPRIQPLMARRQEQKGDSTLEGKSERSGKESCPKESQSVAEVTVHKAAQGQVLGVTKLTGRGVGWKYQREVGGGLAPG